MATISPVTTGRQLGRRAGTGMSVCSAGKPEKGQGVKDQRERRGLGFQAAKDASRWPSSTSSQCSTCPQCLQRARAAVSDTRAAPHPQITRLWPLLLADVARLLATAAKIAATSRCWADNLQHCLACPRSCAGKPRQSRKSID